MCPRPFPERVPPVTNVGRMSSVVRSRPLNSPRTQPDSSRRPASFASFRSPHPRTRRTEGASAENSRIIPTAKATPRMRKATPPDHACG